MQIVPFFINSNICLREENIDTYEHFMSSIAGNTGNSYITYALMKELLGGTADIRHIQNIYKYNFDNADEDIDYINNAATHVFLILQDQIREKESYGLKLPYKKIKNFISKLNKPVIIAGLGANSFNGFENNFHLKLDSELIDFLKFISEHCTEIGIRGHFTEEVLNNIGIKNTKVIGCPSFYEMGESRILNKKNINEEKSIIATSIMPFFNNDIDIIMQDFQEEKFIKAVAYNRMENLPPENVIQNFYNKKYHIFSSIEEWKSFVKKFNFSFGYRLHGAILSINSGVPSICMNADARAKEMCSLFKIPHLPNVKIEKFSDVLRIYENLDYSEMNKEYPILYKEFLVFLHKNNLKSFKEEKQPQTTNYINQPVLNLYGKDFYSNLDNKIFVTKQLEEIFNKQNKKKKKINLFHNIFSASNENKHKVIKIFGIKIKFKRKNR